MAVEAKRTHMTYLADGEVREFPVPFAYSRKADLRLLHTSAAGVETPIISNFQVNVNESGDTSVTFPVTGPPLPYGVRLTIYRDTPLTQIIRLMNTGAFQPEVLEHDGFDRIVMMVQEQSEALDRSVKVPISSGLAGADVMNEILGAREEVVTARDEVIPMHKDIEGWHDDVGQLRNETEAFRDETLELSKQVSGEIADIQENIVQEGDRQVSRIVGKGNNQAARVTNEGNKQEQRLADFAATLAPGIPLLIPMPVPFSTVMPGFLSVTRDNGILTEAAFNEAYAQLLILHEAGDTNIVSVAQWEAEFAANNGICGRFAIDTATKTFRLPVMPVEYWHGFVRPHDESTAFLLVRNTNPVGNVPGIWVPREAGTGGYLVIEGGHLTQQNSPGPIGTPMVANLSTAAMANVPLDYQMKLYGAVTDTGTISLAQLIAAMAGKLDTSVYKADAWSRIRAWVYFNSAAQILGGKNITGMMRNSLGIYRVLSPAITMSSGIIWFQNFLLGGGIGVLESARTNGSSTGEFRGGTGLIDTGGTVLILNE